MAAISVSSLSYFLSLASLLINVASATANSGDDLSALLSLKSAFRSAQVATWTPASDYCRWNGVVCDRFSGRVVMLNLTYGSGTLAASIGNLTELRVLLLGNNGMNGEIPSEIGLLKHLEVLELQGNNFTGGIPKEISGLNLYSLRFFNLSYNYLTGSIPKGLIGSGKIRVLDLSNNQLSGRIVLSDCELLEHLKLSNNFLVGNIPPEIGKCRSLRTLLLDGNILEGSIPPEIGRVLELRVFDVSRNSLTDLIPKELGNCQKLVVIVLTNLDDYSDDRSLDIFRGEYNAFVGGVPEEVFMIPTLQIFWSPRSNIGGQLPMKWGESCSLRVLNLGQNYMDGVIPESISFCRNLTFLDLSSNRFYGGLPSRLHLPCMVYLNVSRNSLSGLLPAPYVNASCGGNMNLQGKNLYFLSDEDILNAYSSVYIWYSQISSNLLEEDLLISHDFGWNNITGSLPSFSLVDTLFMPDSNVSYKLLLNNNDINGSIPHKLLSVCSAIHSFSVNLSANQLSGELSFRVLEDCLALTEFEAAHNQFQGSFFSGMKTFLKLKHLDVRKNQLTGSLPQQLGDLKLLKSLLLGSNNFNGEMPPQLGQLKSLEVLDLSKNDLTGPIPPELAKASDLEILLLDHNTLSGDIPLSFASLSHLVQLDVSYNNLSGHIPHLQHIHDCGSFKGNKFLHSCPDPYSTPPTGLPYPLEVRKWHNRSKMKSLIIATATSVSVVVSILVVIVLALTLGKKKLGALTSLRRKVVVTFADGPIELTYDNVVSATGNFSIRNLIGTGGFGSTYKAEIIPSYLVAVKRLALGKFQGGIQQFEAEIKTLGRVRHKNLVTLIGYYVGDTEMFLIYNYLSGGNLETFIHDTSSHYVTWPEIYKITVDVAHALAYLHYSCVPRIVHRDIKPSNILLDEELNAYLSDFGLARLLEVSQTHATTDVAGTFGYVAPEYATTCRVSDKADVYSFGVVLLELMSGKKSFDPSFSEYGNGFNIVGWATLLMEEKRCSEFFFSGLWEAGPEDSLLGMLELALSCTVESLSIRPSMKQVLEKLKQLTP